MTYLLVFKPSISGESKYLQSFFSFQTHWFSLSCLTNVIAKGAHSLILIDLPSFRCFLFYTRKRTVLADGVKRKLCLQCLFSALISMLCFSFRFVQGNEVSKTDPDGEYHRAVSETLTTCDQNISHSSRPHVSCSVDFCQTGILLLFPTGLRRQLVKKIVKLEWT